MWNIKNRNNIIKKVGWVSVIANSFLFGIKLWAGLISGSVAIIADAWHTLSDSVSSGIVIIGGWIAGKPADEEHPFGHGRMEHIATIAIGGILVVIGYEFLIKAIEHLQTRQAVIYGTIPKIVTFISILFKELLARYSFIASGKTGSPVLKADGWHHRCDALSSLIILAGIFVGKYFWWVDGILGIIVALFIFHTAYGIVKGEISALLGERPDPEIIDRIKAIISELNAYDVVPHHFQAHKYGHHTELSFHIILPPDMILEDVHDICTAIEKEILKEFGYITTIHAEPLSEYGDKY